MVNGTTSYKAHIILTEEEMLDLIRTADALDEIGAQFQCELLRKLIQHFSRVR